MMNTVGLVLLTAVLGIDVGWRPHPDGGLEYIIQIEPELLDTLKEGNDIVSRLPADLRDVRAYRIKVGNGPVPRIGNSPAGSAAGADSSATNANGRGAASGTASDVARASATANAAAKAADEQEPAPVASSTEVARQPMPRYEPPGGMAQAPLAPTTPVRPRTYVPDPAAADLGPDGILRLPPPPAITNETSSWTPPAIRRSPANSPGATSSDPAYTTVAPNAATNPRGPNAVIRAPGSQQSAAQDPRRNGVDPSRATTENPADYQSRDYEQSRGYESQSDPFGNDPPRDSRSSQYDPPLRDFQTPVVTANLPRDYLDSEEGPALGPQADARPSGATRSRRMSQEDADAEEERAAAAAALEKPWGVLTLAVLALFVSLGLNFFLGWVTWGFRQRYADLLDELGSPHARTA